MQSVVSEFDSKMIRQTAMRSGADRNDFGVFDVDV